MIAPLVATAAGVQGAFVAGLIIGIGLGAIAALLLTRPTRTPTPRST